MSKPDSRKSVTTAKSLPYTSTAEVRDRCLCLAAQRAARALARRFDAVLAPLDLTNGQFSLLMALNRPEPPLMRDVANLLAMDRTTLTAALKPLERRRLVTIAVDKEDRRGRRLTLTRAGNALLTKAYPLWKQAHDALDTELSDPKALRRVLWAMT